MCGVWELGWPFRDVPHWDFPGGPVVRTLSLLGHGFDPWSRNQDPKSRVDQKKKKKSCPTLEEGS